MIHKTKKVKLSKADKLFADKLRAKVNDIKTWIAACPEHEDDGVINAALIIFALKNRPEGMSEPELDKAVFWVHKTLKQLKIIDLLLSGSIALWFKENEYEPEITIHDEKIEEAIRKKTYK